MRREVLQRIEALEAADAERVVAWIRSGIDPDTGDAWPVVGWEVVPMNIGSVGHVWRDGDETDDALKARVAVAANQHRGMIVCFAMNANGVTR